MEQILAFVLGVGAVAFIWVVVVAFKTVKKVEALKQNETEITSWIHKNDELINQRVSDESNTTGRMIEEIYSTIDSRFDKFEAKITKEKQVLRG